MQNVYMLCSNECIPKLGAQLNANQYKFASCQMINDLDSKLAIIDGGIHDGDICTTVLQVFGERPRVQYIQRGY